MSTKTLTSRKQTASASTNKWWRSPWLLPTPGFVLLALLTFPPLFYAIYLSLINFNSTYPSRELRFVGLRNYGRVLFDEIGQQAILTTVILSFSATLATLFIGFTVGYLIHLYAGRFTGLLTALILIPMAVSPVAMALVFSLILNPLYGPLPQVVTLLGGPLVSVTASPVGALATIVVAQAWQWSPLAVVLFLGGIQGMPRSPLEAAKIDGATGWQTLRHVTLPLLRPIIAATALFEFILCSQLFAAAQLLTNGGPGRSSTDLSFFIYKIGVAESGQVSVASAAGILALIGSIVLANVWLRVSKWEENIY